MDIMQKSVENTIPLVHTLDEIYDTSSQQMEEECIAKYMLISRRFEEMYDTKPEFFARAPSAVRLMGDHLEYNDHTVISVALTQDVVIAFRSSSEPYIEINNFIENLYRHIKIPIDGSMKPLEQGQDKWANIIIAGFKQVLEELNTKPTKGVQMLIFTNLLEETGVGLEDALRIAVEALAYKVYGNIEVERHKCASGISTMTAIYGKKDFAMQYNSDPTKIQYMKLPEKLTLVIANSLAPIPKLLTLGKRHYKRMAELRIGLAKLHLDLGLCKKQEPLKFTKLADLQKHLGYTAEQMVELLDKHVKKGPYDSPDLEADLGCSLSELLKDLPHYEIVIKDNDQYYIHDRLNYVWRELIRESKLKESLAKGDLSEVGRLITESHEDFKTLYDGSVVEVENLIKVCKEAGSLGSKMTGLGWGGCVLSLVESETAENFTTKVEEYYTQESAAKLWMTEEVTEYIFTSKAGTGAVLLDPTHCFWY